MCIPIPNIVLQASHRALCKAWPTYDTQDIFIFSSRQFLTKTKQKLVRLVTSNDGINAVHCASDSQHQLLYLQPKLQQMHSPPLILTCTSVSASPLTNTPLVLPYHNLPLSKPLQNLILASQCLLTCRKVTISPVYITLMPPLASFPCSHRIAPRTMLLDSERCEPLQR
jgi:hypothetical protein